MMTMRQGEHTISNCGLHTEIVAVAMALTLNVPSFPSFPSFLPPFDDQVPATTFETFYIIHLPSFLVDIDNC